MAIDWYRTDAALFRHPKIAELDELLKQPRTGWYVHGLWSWLVTYRQNGVVERELIGHVERACGWTGQPHELITAMITVGLLDERRDGTLAAHDWREKQGSAFEKAEKDAARKRKQRERDRRESGADASADGHADVPRTVTEAVTRDGAGTVRNGTDGTVRNGTDGTDVSTPALPVAIFAPTSEPAVWLAEDFWRWAQSRRQAAGFVPEKMVDSRKLSGWYSSVLSTLSGNVERLQEAFLTFGDDPYWQKPPKPPPLPFSGFMSQWDRYAPRGPHAS